MGKVQYANCGKTTCKVFFVFFFLKLAQKAPLVSSLLASSLSQSVKNEAFKSLPASLTTNVEMNSNEMIILR